MSRKLSFNVRIIGTGKLALPLQSGEPSGDGNVIGVPFEEFLTCFMKATVRLDRQQRIPFARKVLDYKNMNALRRLISCEPEFIPLIGDHMTIAPKIYKQIVGSRVEDNSYLSVEGWRCEMRIGFDVELVDVTRQFLNSLLSIGGKVFGIGLYSDTQEFGKFEYAYI